MLVTFFVGRMGNFQYNPVKVVDYLENLLNLSTFSGDSNNENIRDLNFVYFFGEVDLFFVCEHNYNYVLQRCFL